MSVLFDSSAHSTVAFCTDCVDCADVFLTVSAAETWARSHLATAHTGDRRARSSLDTRISRARRADA